MKRNAIIIAAGTSSRFVPISYEKPKGLVEVDGEVLIERQIRQLHEAGIEDITIVIGYMAENFSYLSKMYRVNLVMNEDYHLYNNTSSMIRVIDKLNNTYICCSDQFYKSNPFLRKLEKSAYAALYTDQPTNEYCIDMDDNDQILQVRIGGGHSWYMAGFAYFDAQYSQMFKQKLQEEYHNIETRQMYWEDIYIKYINILPPMQAIKFAQKELLEFDSLDELRMYDQSYIHNTRSAIIREMCHTLDCEESDLSDFKKNPGLEGIAFTFNYKKTNYLYLNGEITTC